MTVAARFGSRPCSPFAQTTICAAQNCTSGVNRAQCRRWRAGLARQPPGNCPAYRPASARPAAGRTGAEMSGGSKKPDRQPLEGTVCLRLRREIGTERAEVMGSRSFRVRSSSVEKQRERDGQVNVGDGVEAPGSSAPLLVAFQQFARAHQVVVHRFFSGFKRRSARGG